MASSSKIHLFKKSAIEAGTPELYYLNPSDNLWKVASKWRVVEHEDLLVLTIDYHALGLGDRVTTWFNGKFINIELRPGLMASFEKEIAACFDDKEGMKKFSIEMNPNFLKLGVKFDPTIRLSASVQRIFITKLTPEEIKNYAETKNDPKPKAEEKSKGPFTLEIDVSRHN